MRPNLKHALCLSISVLIFTGVSSGKNHRKHQESGSQTSAQPAAVLWQRPDDIKSRNLYYGSGGAKDAPHSSYTFEEEDLKGTGPKFIVRDENGVRWKVKMGNEVRSETAASRIVWAAGYMANEDYFLPEIHVEGLPSHLSRGQQFIHPAGTAHNVRLKKYVEGEKKVSDWAWQSNPFSTTREINGLRVVMALINNWDTKDINNAVYRRGASEPSLQPQVIYMVSDLGATFGTTGVTWRRSGADGNLTDYRKSKFILKVTPDYVDFATPSRPLLLDIFDPPDFFMRVHMRWIGRRIPRSDVHWIAQALAQLSPEQIRDTFRAAGFSPDEVEDFSKVVEERIADLGRI